MSLYDRAAGTAVRMLKKYGKPLRVRNFNVPTDYDRQTDTGGVQTKVDRSFNGIMLPFEAGTENVRGTLIQVGDVRCYLDPNAEVGPEDHVLDGSTTWQVMSAVELKPATKRLLWDLHLRR